MVSDVEDLTVEYEEDGQLVVEELDKAILSKGAWATILFKYRQWDRRAEDFGPARYTLRRYRKTRDVYRQQAKFNISSTEQARKLVEVLQQWIAHDDG